MAIETPSVPPTPPAQPVRPVNELTLSIALVAVVAVVLAVLLARNDDPQKQIAGAPATTTSSSAPPSQSSTTSAPSSPSQTSEAPKPTGFPAKASYTGTLGQSASLAVLVKGNRVIAYFCDGVREFWLKGTAEEGRIKAEGKKGQKLEANVTGADLTGELKETDRSSDFRLQEAKNKTVGVFGARLPSGLRKTWIVRNDGGQVGLQVNPDGSTSSVPNLTPGATSVTIDGQTVPLTAPSDVPAD